MATEKNATKKLQKAQPINDDVESKEKEIVVLQQHEIQSYIDSSQVLMKSASELQQLNVKRKKLEDEQEKIKVQLDEHANIADDASNKIRDILQKYAFKYEKDVIGVNPQTMEVLFADNEMHQQ